MYHANLFIIISIISSVAAMPRQYNSSYPAAFDEPLNLKPPANHSYSTPEYTRARTIEEEGGKWGMCFLAILGLLVGLIVVLNALRKCLIQKFFKQTQEQEKIKGESIQLEINFDGQQDQEQ